MCRHWAMWKPSRCNNNLVRKAHLKMRNKEQTEQVLLIYPLWEGFKCDSLNYNNTNDLWFSKQNISMAQSEAFLRIITTVMLT